MSFGYGRKDPPYGTAQFPYHRGDDYACPEGTPITVNGVLIGYVGHTGFVTGPHVHIGRFVGGRDTNPNSTGWSLSNPHVTDIGYDDVNGNYVGLVDSDGVRWVYLHMRERSTAVKVGDYLSQLPKFNQGEDDMTDENFVRAFFIDLFDVEPTAEQLAQYINRPWKEVYNELRSALPHQQLVTYFAQLKKDDDARVQMIVSLEAQVKQLQNTVTNDKSQEVITQMQALIDKYKAAEGTS